MDALPVRNNIVTPCHLLVADTQLYERLCQLVHWCVGPLARRSVGLLVHEHKLKSEKTSVLDAFHVQVCVLKRSVYLMLFVYDCMCMWGEGVCLGVESPCPPVLKDVVTPRNLFK